MSLIVRFPRARSGGEVTGPVSFGDVGPSIYDLRLIAAAIEALGAPQDAGRG
jgi:hypothetical protein